MKKVVSTCLILILLVLFGADFYCSRKSEAVFRAEVEKLRHSYAGILQVRLEEYHAGLLLSRARLRLTFSAGGTLLLQHRIRHFPWGAHMVTRLETGSELASELAGLLPLDQLQLLTVVDLRGRSQTTLDLPDMHTAGEGGVFSLKQLKFACDLAPSLQSGRLRLTLATMEIGQAGWQRVALHDVKLQSRFAEQQGIPFGSGELHISQALVDSRELPGLELKELNYRSKMYPEGETIASMAELRLAELVLAGERFNQLRLKLKLSGIAPAEIRELLDTVKQMQADLLSRRVDPLVLQVQLFGLLPQLFRNGFEASLEQFELHCPEGDLQGNGSLHLHEQPFSAAAALNWEHLDAALQLDIDGGAFACGVRLLDKLQHRGRPSARAGVLNELAEQLAGGLVQKGVLTRRGPDGYRLQLSIKRGQGLLNGQPFNP